MIVLKREGILSLPKHLRWYSISRSKPADIYSWCLLQSATVKKVGVVESIRLRSFAYAGAHIDGRCSTSPALPSQAEGNRHQNDETSNWGMPSPSPSYRPSRSGPTSRFRYSKKCLRTLHVPPFLGRPPHPLSHPKKCPYNLRRCGARPRPPDHRVCLYRRQRSAYDGSGDRIDHRCAQLLQ
jgi:hypothetical protein